MRRIAIINQKGGVGKTTTTANLGAALAIQGRRVVLVDMDAQANLSLALGVEARSGSPTTYSLLSGTKSIDACLRATKVPNLRLLPSNIDLSGAELELASAMGREYLLRDALKEWDDAHRQKHGKAAADYVLFDCPPSLGLLSINALAAAGEVLITLQTEFLALQGMSKLVEIVALLKKRLNPDLVVTGIVPTLYDIRLKLAREVLGEIRRYFKDQVMPHPIRANVKLAEAPSFGQTIFEYAPDSHGALDYTHLAQELLARESRDADLAGLPAFDATKHLPSTEPVTAPMTRRMPPPRKKKAVEPPVAASSTSSVSATAPVIAAQPARPTVANAVDADANKASANKAAASKSAESKAAESKAPANADNKAKPNVHPKPTEAPPAVSHPTNQAKAATSKKDPTPAKSPASTNVPAPMQSAVSTSAPLSKSTPGPTKSSGPTRAAAPAKDVPAKPAASSGSQPKPAAHDESQMKSAVANGVHAKTATSNGAHAKPVHDKSPRSEPTPTRTQSKTLKPVPRTARVDDIPPLPPDAFEILSTPIDP